MPDITIAIYVSVLVTILLAFIQIANGTKNYEVGNYFTPLLFMYIAIMAIGNIVTTYGAANLIDNWKPTEETAKKAITSLTGPRWIWYSTFGVFGFQAIIQKLNITLFDKGVLSINDWITQAKTSAIAAALAKKVDNDIRTKQWLANRLYKKLSTQELHTFALANLGPDKYNKVTSNTPPNPEMYLAYILASEIPMVVKAEIVNHNS